MDSVQDLRIGYIKYDCVLNNAFATASVNFTTCAVHHINSIYKVPVCFTADVLKYAQSSFFVAVVLAQFSNSISSKTRVNSVITQPLSNTMMIMGWIIELVLCFCICYIKPIEQAFQTRGPIFLHFGFYGCVFSILLLIYDETRKFLIRNFPQTKNKQKPNWFQLRTMM